MVKKFINLLGREISGLHEAAYLLGFFAIASQLLGLFRDRLLANIFGASTSLDIYYAAFRIPDLIFVIVASLVSASVLIPYLSEKLSQGEVQARGFINSIFSLFGIVIVTVSFILLVLMPIIIPPLFPGFTSPQVLKELVLMSRILLLSPILLGLSNLLSSITQLKNRFFIFALSPVFYNLGIIAGIVFLTPIMGIIGVVVGVTLGAFLHLVIQIPFILSTGLFPRLVKPQLSIVRSVVLASLPRTIAISSNELARFFLIAFASLLGVGSISIFNLSSNMSMVPLSVIGVSYSMAAFPTLTRFFSSGNIEKFLEHLSTSLRHIVFLSVPVVVIFVVLRAQIVRVILGSGEFSWSDTRLTAAALAIFILALIPQSITLLFTRARYSTGKTSLPLVINVASAALVVAFTLVLSRLFSIFPELNLALAGLMRVDDISGASMLILPLAFAAGSTLGAIAHLVTFEKEYPRLLDPTLKTFTQALAASLAMGVVSYTALNVLDDVFALDTFIGIFAQGLLSGVAGIVTLISVLIILQSRELFDMWSAFHRKFWKARVVAADTELSS